MPRITEEMCDRIWSVYQRTPSYTLTGKELSVDRRTVRKCIQRKRAELAQRQQELAAHEETKTRERRVKAFKMFKDGKSLQDVAIGLRLEYKEAKAYEEEWLLITNRKKVLDIFSEIGEAEFEKFLKLYNEIRAHEIDPEALRRPLKEHKPLQAR